MILWVDGAHDATENMRRDARLLDAAGRGALAEPILRLFRFGPHGITLGHGQEPERELDLDACRARSLGWARRPTGGRAILHAQEWTYALVAPIGHPDWGGTYFLPRLVGVARALELVFTGDMIDAQEAFRIGLVNRVVPRDRLEEETRALARTLAAKPPIALALAKQALYATDRHSLRDMLDIELRHQLACFQSHDAAEGLQAFLEKRSPTFQGK